MKLVFRLALLGSCLAATLSAQTILAQWRFGEGDAGATNGGAVGATTTATVGSDLSLVSGAATYANSTPGGGSTLSVDMNAAAQFSTAAYTALTNGSSFIMEMWFKPTSVTGDQYLLYNGDTSNNGIGLYLHNSGVQLLQGGHVDETANATVSAGQWNYAALVWDAGTARVYVNDISAPTFTAGRSINDPTGTFVLGINYAGGVDEARISTFTSGTFNTSMLNYASVSAVPEPSTYAALAGVAALGLVAWRRRQARA
ncbi:MAG: LamG domain-containing protein [Candidatus Didemnitutus sp.]|nr:LamG domain-containing protein [Candidatus Didemnitutus sp.]